MKNKKTTKERFDENFEPSGNYGWKSDAPVPYALKTFIRNELQLLVADILGKRYYNGTSNYDFDYQVVKVEDIIKICEGRGMKI